MHDAITCELQGVPALAVVTDEFIDAAEYTLACLGADDYAFSHIKHPISSATRDELTKEVHSVMDEAINKILLGKK